MKYYRIKVKEVLENRPLLTYTFSVTCPVEAANILMRYSQRGSCTMKVSEE